MFDSTLGSVFNFTASDLEYNRKGQLSPTQQQAIASMNRSCVQVAGLATLFFIALTAGSFFVLGGENGTGAAVTLGIFAVLCGAGFLLAWTTRNDGYEMHAIEGEARLRVDTGDKAKRYTINIKGHDFTVAPNQYEIIEDGTSYKIYYSVLKGQTELKTASKQIKSLERMS